MRAYLLLAAGLALASCAAQKALPHYTEAEKQAQRESISWWKPAPPPAQYRVPAADSAEATKYEAMPDSLPFVKVPQAAQKPTQTYEVEGGKKGFLARLFWPGVPKKPVSAGVAKHPNATQVPRKCKGCTFNVVAGNQTNAAKKAQVLGDGASNTQTGKKSGDIIKADSGAIVSKVGGPGNIQTTRGNNNAPQLSAPVQEAADWRATIAKPVGYALASMGTLLIVGGCIVLIAAYRRRHKSQA
jgi:hypothetical protein